MVELLTLPTTHIVGLCALLALMVYRLGLLTGRGSAAAFFIAVFIWSIRGFEWLAILLLFFVMGSAATKWKYDYKKEVGTAEAREGKRSVENVIGSSYAPLLFVIFTSPVGFLSSVAGAMADNMASELGVLSQNVRLITTLRKVPPGTDGGISFLGLVISAAAAGVIALVSPLMGVTDPAVIFIIWISGFMGSVVDSLLGATIERAGWVGKTEVNVAATLFSGLFALSLIWLEVPLYLAPYIPF